MTIYAIAKILGPGIQSSTRANGNKNHVNSLTMMALQPMSMSFVLHATSEAESRLDQLAFQGLSNIAWSLAFLRMQNQSTAQSFIQAATNVCIPNMSMLHPQAIANLAFAVKMFDGRLPDVAANFAVHACHEAWQRMSEAQSHQGQLEWRDLSCILLLAARTEARTSSSVALFASLLCDMVVMHDRDIENHAFLNIAVGCGRLGVPPDMVERVIRCLECRVHQFNDTDLRQWNEVSWRYPTLCTQYECSKVPSPKTGAKHSKACVSAASIVQNKGRRASP